VGNYQLVFKDDDGYSLCVESDYCPKIGETVGVYCAGVLAEEAAAPGTYLQGDLDWWRSADGSRWIVDRIEHEVTIGFRARAAARLYAYLRPLKEADRG
jgi:hypothetical protein